MSNTNTVVVIFDTSSTGIQSLLGNEPAFSPEQRLDTETTFSKDEKPIDMHRTYRIQNYSGDHKC